MINDKLFNGIESLLDIGYRGKTLRALYSLFVDDRVNADA